MRPYGRPLRFLAIVGLSWLCARLYFLSPFASAPAGPPPPLIAARDALPSVVFRHAETVGSGANAREASRSVTKRNDGEDRAGSERLADRSTSRGPTPSAALTKPISRTQPVARLLPIQPPAPGRIATPLLRVPASSADRSSRFNGYAYIFARSGSGASSLASEFGQLGGSQAGVRLDYALSERVALTARATAPLAISRDREVAIGIRWRPARLPVDVIAERRQSLGRGGRDAFAVMATGGVGPIALPVRFRLEAYGQAGVVGLKRRDAFVEGQVTALRDVARAGPATLALGAGAWGGAQPGVERLDVGPRARVGLALGERAFGLALDYRRRVAGDARPGSGATLTLDTSF